MGKQSYTRNMTNRKAKGKMKLYAITRMLDGSFTLKELKPMQGFTMERTDSKRLKRLHRQLECLNFRSFVMVEVTAYQEYFTAEGKLAGEDRRLLVPAAMYCDYENNRCYVVPLTHEDVKLPLSFEIHEPGGGYVNPTILSERPRKPDAE